MDIGTWIGICALFLAVPLGVASNLLTSRLIRYLERRKLIKEHQSRQAAATNFKRIQEFREGKRDKYPFYLLLSSAAIICAVIASTFVVAGLLVATDLSYKTAAVGIGVIVLMLGLLFLVGIYTTARQLERFDEFKKEFEEKWGPIEE